MARRHRAGRPRRDAPPAGGRRTRGLAWTGAISFGLVNIPVSLRSGEAARELRFSLLDKKDLSPIGYRKVNKNTGEEVPSNRVAKGYKVGEDEYVLLTDEDFRRASPERTQRIDIRAFVDAGALDPALFERPYFVEPEPKSEKAYALLREALKRTGKTGIATIVLHTRQHTAALWARGPALTLELLRYAADLRDPGELHLPGEGLEALGVTEAEVRMAQRLVEELSGPWRPEDYRDEYRAELLSFIEAKAKAGKGRAAAPGPAPSRRAAPPADIMSLLKRSLAQGRRGA